MRISIRCALLISVAIAGCGSRHAGTYTADARMVLGAEESAQPGYSFAEVEQKVRSANKSLTLQADGRFVWNTGPAVNEGTWRIEDGTLFLRDDISNDTPILPELQDDREWRIGPNGEFITGTYTAYNIEEFYTRQ